MRDTVRLRLVRPLAVLEPLAVRGVAAFLSLKLRRTAAVVERAAAAEVGRLLA